MSGLMILGHDSDQMNSFSFEFYSDEDASESGDRPLIDDSQRRMQLQVVDNELEYNESMIVQREEEIREIESGITELNEIFRDLGTMVYEQGSMLGKFILFLIFMIN